MYYWILDKKYKGYLISVYRSVESRLYQVLIRKGNGLENTPHGKDWQDPLFTVENVKGLRRAKILGKKIIEDLLIGVHNHV